jgi:hypothetical protein
VGKKREREREREREKNRGEILLLICVFLFQFCDVAQVAIRKYESKNENLASFYILTTWSNLR